MTEKVAV